MSLYDNSSTPGVKAPSPWADLVRLEPELGRLKRQARLVDPSRADFWHVYETLKSRLKALVGWNARRPELATSEAYQLAIHHIVAALEAPSGRPRRSRQRPRKRRPENCGRNGGR